MRNANVIAAGLKEPATSDGEGNFILKGLRQGSYELTISHIGYQVLHTTIVVNGGVAVTQFVLTATPKNLDTVMVTAAVHTGQAAGNQPIRAVVIGMRGIQQQPASVTELMNRTAGLRVRQSGGLGANTNLAINGFEGKAIKYFKDGIPMDYLGAAFNFSVVPVNMLERIEVYKGVLPAGLGADALGGAVNMVTRKENTSGMSLSYQYGSYNTHRASLHAQYVNKRHTLFAGTDVFYNHSDNNYKVDVPVTDTATAVSHTEKLPLFHNRYDNIYMELYAGVKNLGWTDELRMGLTWFDIRRQNNYGATMVTPLGAVTAAMYSVLPTFRYRKQFFDGRLQLDQFLVAGVLHSELVDTIGGVYSWHGRFTPVPSRRGEISADGSFARLDYRNTISRTNIVMELHPQHTLTLNTVYATSERTGADPFGKKFPQSGKDVLTLPAKYQKLVIAAGLESSIPAARLSNNIIAKYYQVKTSGNDGSYATSEEDFKRNNTQRFGLAEAIRYSLHAGGYLRLSAEAATRLPEQAEFFGDGNFVIPNFTLKPEKSYNLNLGLHLGNDSVYSAEVNTFYRRTTDMILEISSGIFAQNQNVQKVKGLGVEIDGSVHLLPWLIANGNLTYQDMRLFGQLDPTYEGARLRNTPYFFCNLGLQGSFKRLLFTKDAFRAYWYYGFVRSYYLNYIPKANEPKGWLGLWGKPDINTTFITIPDQHLHTVGCSWWPSPSLRCSIGLEVKNLFDTPLYDNFRIQNAGRSYQVKLTYQIN